MRRKRFIYHLVPAYLTVTILALVATGWFSTSLFKRFYISQTTSDLKARAEILEPFALEFLQNGNFTGLDSTCKQLGHASKTRFTVIAADGRVLGDTEEDPTGMENHADRPEFRDAQKDSIGVSIRYSPTLKKKMIYVAVPLENRTGEFAGTIRASVPLTAVRSVLLHVDAAMAVGGLIMILVAALLSYVISRRISKPLEQIKRGAERFAGGELSLRLTAPDMEEFTGLADALNKTAGQLSERINTISSQRNELEAVLGSMSEGVLAVDMDARLIKANRSAATMLGFNLDDCINRSLFEIARYPNLQKFVAGILMDRKNQQDEVAFDIGDRYLQVQGTILHDINGHQIGALIMLHDITRIRHLENMRRDFAANVSHELRTPITAIKGFIETLRDGALNDPEAASRFLNIITRHVDRLNSIIEELLSLAKIERETETGQVELGEGNLKETLLSAVKSTRIQAESRGIRIEVDCPDDLSAQINPPLFEQAMVNLLDNACNYSPEGAEVKIEVEESEAELRIFVKDFGCGMEARHLPHIFERFYRIDPDRSRKQGGTGLGLAIVKHIALAHGGRVSVVSKPGEGSTFTIHLPKTRRNQQNSG